MKASNLDQMKARYEELASNPLYILLCATMDEVVVGSVMGIVCDELYGECRPFLLMENLVVDAGCRRHGIGKALLSELENRLANGNVSDLSSPRPTERRCFVLQISRL
jgi:ribosomal protein S18 acetylase RimI-like enzyme